MGIIGDTLVQERWITGKRKGKAFDVTGHFFGYIFGDDNPENFKDLPYDLKKETDFQQAEFSRESKENIERMKKENILKRKSGNEKRQKAQRSGNLELSRKAEEDLMQWAMDNGEVNTDDEDDFIDWLDNNLDDILKGKIREM